MCIDIHPTTHTVCILCTMVAGPLEVADHEFWPQVSMYFAVAAHGYIFSVVETYNFVPYF